MSAKKPAHWITIPNKNTPAPQAWVDAKDASDDRIKNKGWWAIGFILIALLSWALLSPGQFNALIQGNLFDQSGLSDEQVGSPISPLALLPKESTEKFRIKPMT
ncbi:hypothetical protein IPJ72_05885 [Candidatus Peregrinibacteria bacterium]|nr:MAG: hypothetical protein IPJ72_05885 [Candidatus Peregrinibacteria bacterium]